MAAARFEGGRVMVDDGGATMTKSLRKRTATTHFEGGVKVAAFSGDGNEAAACSWVEIVDDRWRWWCGRFKGDSRARESAGSKFC
jgi:hypothetical protein